MTQKRKIRVLVLIAGHYYLCDIGGEYHQLLRMFFTPCASRDTLPFSPIALFCVLGIYAFPANEIKSEISSFANKHEVDAWVAKHGGEEVKL